MIKINMSFERPQIQWSHIGITFNLRKFKYLYSTKVFFFPHTIWLPNMSQLLNYCLTKWSFLVLEIAVLDFGDMVQYK